MTEFVGAVAKGHLPPRDTTALPRADSRSLLFQLVREPSEPHKVPVPEKYKTYLPSAETIVEEDVAFFEKTRNKYAIAERGAHREDQPELERDTFLAAARDVISYGTALRKTDWDILDDDLSESDILGETNKDGLNRYQKTEKKRDSNLRMVSLVSLFLHHPQFKGAYRSIHQDKLQQALPHIKDQLNQHSMEAITNLNQYFTVTQGVLCEGMKLSANTFSEEQRDVMGILIGYQNKGILIPRPVRTNFFANIGTGTFLDFLRTTIAETVEKGAPLQDVLQREVLARDGVGFQLMRMHIFDFTNEIEEELVDRPLEQQRRILAATETHPGLCPATLLTPAGDGDKPRPIVYELATVIANAIPERLREQKK